MQENVSDFITESFGNNELYEKMSDECTLDRLLLAVLRSGKLQLLCAFSDDLRASAYVRKYSSRRHKD
jgi:hypothetical protein